MWNYNYSTNPVELYHYGVLGMKWGVRRNARLLANHQRNAKVNDIKKQYRLGVISKEQKRRGIKEANIQKKKDLTSIKLEIKNAKNKKEYNDIKKRIALRTVNEVPHSTIKKGATIANKLIHGASIVGTIATGTAAASVSAAMYPSLVGPVLVSSIASATITRGQQALIQMGIDKLT